MSRSRMMYIQRGTGAGRIGRVRLSKTGRTLYYGDVELTAIGGGYKANYIDSATSETYWVSGPRKDGQDTFYPGRVEIDEEVREEYWREIRGMPGTSATDYQATGVHGDGATR